MKILIIFDGTVDMNICHELQIYSNKNDIAIDLFPLTSDWSIIHSVESTLKLNFNPSNITLLDSASYVNQSVDDLQTNIHAWSCNLGNHTIRNKKLKEWMLLPDKNISTWWFSLISEKNSLHDDAFLKIAQINAIHETLIRQNYSNCIVTLSDRKQAKILINLCLRLNINVRSTAAKTSSQGDHLLFSCGRAVITLCKWMAYSCFIKLNLSSLKKRLKKANPFLFVSYFPNVSAEDANKAKFQNKYAIPLQDKFRKLKIPISWILMPVQYNGYSFYSSIKLAKKFLKNDESIFILYEFFNAKIFIKSLLWWIRQVFISYFVFYMIDKRQLTGSLTCKESLPMIRHLWLISFADACGMRGIIYYLTFSELFKKMQVTTQCLYYCEMQAWEKALNAAKKIQSPAIKTWGFQHTAVTKNHFNYFYDPRETIQTEYNLNMPLPDLLLANGKRMYRLLFECNYPNLHEVEAIRHLYLSNIIDQPRFEHKKNPVLLIAGSFDKVETKSLITMVHQAFPAADKFEIWFKGYPANPVEPLFNELNIHVEKAGYKIFHHDIASLLDAASIVFVPGSTVAVEALAYGCRVIVPLFVDVIQKNPLVGTDAKYDLVSSVEEFKRVVNDAVWNQDAINFVDIRQYINDIWNIENKLPLWEEILMTR